MKTIIILRDALFSLFLLTFGILGSAFIMISPTADFLTNIFRMILYVNSTIIAIVGGIIFYLITTGDFYE